MTTRQKIIAPIVTAALLLGQVGTAFADDAIHVYLKGKLQSFEQPPIIKDGSTLVPMRAIFEALGATVKWDGEKQIIDATKDGKTIRLQIGWKGAWIGQTKAELAVAPEIVNGSTMVPLRFIGEALGEKVEWDGDTNSVLISTDKSQLLKADSGAYKGYADTLQQLISNQTETGLNMTDSTYQVLVNNSDAFFAPDRDQFALINKSKSLSMDYIIKNPSKYNSTIVDISDFSIEDIKEINLDNGEVVTMAYGRVSGKRAQVFSIGSTKLGVGDSTKLYGIPVGETTVGVVKMFGIIEHYPSYVFVAGNYYTEWDKMVYEEKIKEQKRDDDAAKEQAAMKPAQDIIEAAKEGNVEQIQAMLKQGTDPNIQLKGTNPLQAAAGYGQAGVINVLIQAGANPNLEPYPLFSAVNNGKLEAVSALLQGKANPNVKEKVHYQTPLEMAVKNADIPIIKALLEAGADPMINSDGITDSSALNYAQGKSRPPLFASDEEIKKANTYKEIYELLKKYVKKN